MHSLAHTLVAQAHNSALLGSARALQTAAIVTVTELPRQLEPVTRDPLIDGLEDAIARSQAVDLRGAANKAQRTSAVHEHQRASVIASLLRRPAR
jgi:hypothetical protein